MNLTKLFFLTAAATVATAAHAQIFTFSATFDGTQENPPNDSPATGTATGRYDVQTREIFIESMVIRDLTSRITLTHIHRGARGTNGGVIVELLEQGAGRWEINGNVATYVQTARLFMPEAEVPNWLRGDTYFNIHTENFPRGEARGQIEVVPEPATMLALAGAIGALVARRRRK